MPTLTRVSTFSGDLGEAVRRYCPSFRPIRSILGNTIQYGLYSTTPRPNLIISSKQRDERLNPCGYNVILTVTSDDSEFNISLATGFQDVTGIELRTAPEEVASRNQMIDLTFQIFKRHGGRAMEALM